MKTEEDEYATNDWNGYILVDARHECTVATVTTSSCTEKSRLNSDIPIVLSCSNRENMMEQNLLNKITYLRRDNISCDVYLRTDDGTLFSAHKTILSMVSPYFVAMFQSNMMEKSQAIIKIQGVESFALKCLINYAYSADIVVTANNIFEVLVSANMLRFEEVESACINFLCRNLDINNCADILTISEVINSMELYELAIIYILNNFRLILRHPNLAYFSVEQLEILLSNDNIDVVSEAQVFDAVVSWVKFDLITRKQYLPRLLKHVRLTLMSRKYLVDIVLREGLVMNEELSRNIALEALDHYILPERTCLLKTKVPHSPRQASYRNLFVLGGKVKGNSKRSCETYNFKTKTWATLPSMKYPKHSACAVLLDGNLYVLGGMCGNKELSIVEKYNSVSETWNNVASLRKCKGTLSATIIDGWIYAAGGSAGRKEALQCAEQYDPISDTWIDLPDMKCPRSSFGIAQLDGKLYAVGGYCGISETDHCEFFDTHSKMWTRISPLNKSRMNHAVVTCQERLYAIGGKSSMGLVNSIEKYNPKLNMWLVIKTNFEMRLGMNICSVTGSRVYDSTDQSVFVVGGLDTSEKYLKQVTTVSLKSPDFQNGSFYSMLEERAFPAVALL